MHAATIARPLPTIDTETGDYIVCQDSQVYHLHDHPRRTFSTGVSLCRHVDAWPAGGLYRSGRRKPVVSTHPPRGRRLCAACASAAIQRATPVTPLRRRIAWLWGHATRMPDKRLRWSAQYAPKTLARHVARLELELRAQGIHKQIEEPMELSR